MSRSALSGATVLDCGARQAPESAAMHLVPLVVWLMGLGLSSKDSRNHSGLWVMS